MGQKLGRQNCTVITVQRTLNTCCQIFLVISRNTDNYNTHKGGVK